MIVDSTIRQSGRAPSQCHKLIAGLMAWALLFCTIANAGTRVLVRFDETGHYSHRVHRSASTSAQSALSLSTRGVTAQLATNSEITLRWLDSNGKLLAATRLIDPRVTHAPLESGNTEFAWTVLTEGAYLASGPDSAVQLEINLPARSTPDVPAETWLIDLN